MIGVKLLKKERRENTQFENIKVKVLIRKSEGIEWLCCPNIHDG